MNIQEIENLQVYDVYDILLERLDGQEITDELLASELEIYRAELIAEENARIKLEALAFYESIKESEDMDLSVEMEIEYILIRIEVVEVRNAEIDFETLILVFAIKPEFDVEWNSKQIKEMIASLLSQDAHLIEQARVLDIHTRLDAVGEDTVAAMTAIGKYRANVAWFRNHTLVEMGHEEAELLLASIETQASKDKPKRLKKEKTKKRKANGKMVRELTYSIIDVIIGYNLDSPEHIATRMERLSDIHELLKNYLPFTAKPFINAIVVDEIITQEMKDEALECYNG